jgi:hypothetical protein
VRAPAAARAALAFLLAAASPVLAQEFPEAEAKLRREVAVDLLSLADWCYRNQAKVLGIDAVDECREMDRLATGIELVDQGLRKMTIENPADPAALQKKRGEAGKEIARRYDRLAALKHDPKDDARFGDYGLRALRWDPADARVQRAATAAEEAGRGNRPVEAGLLVRGILRADPEGAAKGRYDALLERIAQRDVFVLGSPSHDLVAFVSLPKDWKKGKPFPVLVGAEGAGCNFLGYLRGLTAARGSRPVIAVTPMGLSNTNTLEPTKYPAYGKALLDRWSGDRIAFDGAGMEAVLAEVRKRFGGEEKVFVTGFSGGGNYCYWKLLHDPAGVRGAVPCCGNFAGYGADGAPGAGAAGGPPVRILTGEKDPHREFTFGNRDSPGIEPQTDRACEILKGLGYAHVERIMVKGAGHSALPDQVWKFVDEVLAAK